MQIFQLLKEISNFDIPSHNDSSPPSGNVSNAQNTVAMADLNSLQRRTLSRLQSNQVTIEDASDKELDIIMSLIELGLVDDDGNVIAAHANNDSTDINNNSSLDMNTTIDDDFSNLDDKVDGVDDDIIDFSISKT